jgi:Bacterial protein of unknown function (HtrL_YibB)
MTAQVTFVTAFMNIYDKPLHDIRDISWRFDHFAKLAKTGIPICVYVDTKSEDFMRQFIDVFDEGHRVRIMRVLDITDTWVHKTCLNAPVQMPPNRTPSKDTYEYMVLMNSKIEFLKDTIEQNPWNTDHFAWIDFNIWHVFKDHAASANQLRHICYNRFPRASEASHKVMIPGCWGEFPAHENLVPEDILGKIHWRFCGGFFLGHRAAILDLWRMYETKFPEFLTKYNNTIVWEVNFWAWLEAFCNWKPQWFLADHDDRMIQIPIEESAACLVRDFSANVTIYPYKEIPGYYPMSASFVEFGQPSCRALNTRYVNYRLTPQGAYIFNDPNRVIRTKNVFSILDQNWMPVNFQEMADPEIPSKPIPECPFDGIEDIRIFPSSGRGDQSTIRFIGTSINYSNTQSNRMVIGTYDTRKSQLTDARVLDSPDNAYCEKNWSPVYLDQDTPVRFIYKWSPFQVVDTVAYGNEFPPATDRLCTDIRSSHTRSNGSTVTPIIEHKIESPIFRRFRGSSAFVPSIHFPDKLIGVVHFSQNDWPRDYYHALVLLDRHTLRPVAMTSMFTFCEYKAIEFCIGFSETVDHQYIFWISQFDRDARMISVATNKFSWCDLL